MFVLPDLPYPYEALEPVLSAELMHFHHDKHHATYVNNLNKFLGEAGTTPASMEEVVRDSAAKDAKKIFNNSAQAWNHAFFWLCMTPDRSDPDGALREAIDKAFGGLDQLKTKFVQEGVDHFGSGWVWLAATPNGLEVRSTHDAVDLVGEEHTTPLLTCDLWEHAYYVDYKNDRKGFLEAWFDRVADWSFAAHQFEAAHGEGEPWRYPAPEAEQARRQA